MKHFIPIIVLCLLPESLVFGGGLPVVDVAAITAQRLTAQRDYLEQVLHGLEQADQTTKLVEQIRQIDTSLERLGDPAAIKNLQGLDVLYRQLKTAPVIQLPELKVTDLQTDEVFRSLDSNLYQKLEKEITLDGRVAATRDDQIYHPEVAERRSQASYQIVKASVLTRREELRNAHSATLKQLQEATTSSEVAKLSGLLTGLQSELRAADQELVFAAHDAQIQIQANATEKEIQRKAAVERERASLRVSTRKDAEVYQLFTKPIHFAEQP
jgi:hypothetical protein